MQYVLNIGGLADSVEEELLAAASKKHLTVTAQLNKTDDLLLSPPRAVFFFFFFEEIRNSSWSSGFPAVQRTKAADRHRSGNCPKPQNPAAG